MKLQVYNKIYNKRRRETDLRSALEKFMATKMPNFASKGICLKKHDEAIKMLFDGITRWIIRLQNEFGPEALEIIIKNTQFQLGREIAEQIKKEYRLGNEIDDALDLMWILIVPFGIKMKAEKIAKGQIREEKLACPIFDVFKRHGVDYCELLCISLGNGWLHAINPNLKFKLVRKGGKNHYCIKDIVDTSKLPPKKEKKRKQTSNNHAHINSPRPYQTHNTTTSTLSNPICII
jgi:hypothetical protein